MLRVTLLKKKVRGKLTSTYYLNFGHGDVRSTGIRDPDLAEQLRRREEAKLVLSAHGMPDPTDHKRLLTDYIKQYEAKLLAPGCCDDYVSQTIVMIGKIVKAYKWRTPMSIRAADVNDYAAKLREGHASRTVHSHLTAIKGFTKYLTEQGKLAADPLACIKKPPPKRETSRRMLLPEEWPELRKTTLAENKEHHGMRPQSRILLYATSIQTGLRQSECRSLTRANLFLDGDEPFITCPGSATKNGDDAKQYIKPDLAAELRANLAGRGKVFQGMPDKHHVAEMLRTDVAAARAAWINEAKAPGERTGREESDFLLAVNFSGEVLDAHALRHTCGAWLALAGVHPKVIQAVMRHGTITLTMDAYGHLLPKQTAGAIGKLPDMMNT